jgi:hypothetical protein
MGAQSYYSNVFHPTIKGTTTAAALSIGFFLDMPTSNTTINGICYKSVGWSFSEDDMINTYAHCNGSGFLDTYDQLIVSGTGKYDCTTGYVVQKNKASGDGNGDDAIVTFDFALCKDRSDCV